MSRIFNHNNVTVDRENVISLDIIHYPKPPEIEETDEENAEEEDAAESVLTEDEAAEIAEGIIEKAHREAAEYKTATFDEVNAEVAALREAAQAETVEIKAAAYDEGYQTGYDEGKADAQVIIDEAERVKQDAEIEHTELINSSEPYLVEFVADVIAKLIGGEILFNKTLINALVKKGLSETTLSGNIVIHVSKDDFDAVSENKDEILSELNTSVSIEVLRDLSLKPCDCIIETDFGDIDCSLSGQYQALRENLFYILENN